jgi:hypothetical protein
MVTQKRLKELFYLADGQLFWKDADNHRKRNKVAGTLDKTKGRWRLIVDGKTHYLHRLIFLYVNGYLPKLVDHIDGNPLNNSPCNLREATPQQNNFNRGLESTSTTGIKGVCWYGREGKWRVQMNVNGKRKTIGSFRDIELAELVAQEARSLYHGEFCRNQ